MDQFMKQAFIVIFCILLYSTNLSIGLGEKVMKTELLVNYSDIEDSMLGQQCNFVKFQDLSPVWIVKSSDDDVLRYNNTFNKMVEEIRKDASLVQDICFHKKYFINCKPDLENKTGKNRVARNHVYFCGCAHIDVWDNFKYVEVGQKCLIGKGGRCDPDPEKMHLFECHANRSCKPQGTYDNGKTKHVCGLSTRLMEHTPKFLMFFLLAWLYFHIS